MGCAFNCIVVPKSVQTREDLQKFFEDTFVDLIEEHGGDDFEGCFGDLASIA
jgi:hypothetical protein